MALAMLAGFCWAAEAPGELLKRWTAAKNKAGNFRVEFTQEVTNPALLAPATTPGVFWRFDDGSFRWELGQPLKLALLKRGDELRLWEAENPEWKAVDAKDRRFRSWLPFLSGQGLGKDGVENDFEVSASEVETGCTRIKLVPRGMMAKKFLQSIELDLALQALQLKQVAVSMVDGAATRMIFGQPQLVPAEQRVQILGDEVKQ